jgi:hypothetical protein
MGGKTVADFHGLKAASKVFDSQLTKLYNGVLSQNTNEKKVAIAGLQKLVKSM